MAPHDAEIVRLLPDLRLMQMGETETDHRLPEKFGAFLQWEGTPIAGWLIKENPIKMDDLGVALFHDMD